MDSVLNENAAAHAVSALRSKLWLTARVSAINKSDNDEIRHIRECACRVVTETTRGRAAATPSYDALDANELALAIDYIKVGAHALMGVRRRLEFDEAEVYASHAQRRKIHFLALNCAAFYAPTDETFTADKNSLRLTGNALRDYRVAAVRANSLPSAMQRGMYAWINPKMHEILRSAGLRYLVRPPQNPEYFKWDALTSAEANAIIRSLQKMYNEIQMRYLPPNNYSNN